jgi:UTP--glucose-1-phosphate uridylyltransferase
LRSELRPPPADAIQKLPASGSAAMAKLVQAGSAAIARGEFGVAVLNGGMATRFGGVVKGVVEMLPGRSFLKLVAEDVLAVQKRHGGRIQLFLMNSFATDKATKAHLREHRNFGLRDDQVHHFTQYLSLRMRPDGSVFLDEHGEPSPYGPGHGDFVPAFRQSCLRPFLQQGGKYLFVRNVDNVGARVHPGILGFHAGSGKEMTVEVAERRPEDVGGAPFVVDGRLQLIEQIRYPKDFDPSGIRAFNTNTFTFSAKALDREFELGWYVVEKQVAGGKAIQIERLIGEMTRWLDSNYLQIERSGRDNRFLPVKTPEDMAAARSEIAAMYPE